MQRWVGPVMLVLMLPLGSVFPAARAGELPVPPEAIKKSSLVHHEAGGVRSFILKEPRRIQGYLCRELVQLDPEGRIRQLVVAEPTRFGEIDVPARSEVRLREDGTLDWVSLSRNTVIQEIPCRGGTRQLRTTFHPCGGLAWCFLSRKTTIQGIPCRADDRLPTGFHPNGKLARCSLARKHEFRGRKLPWNTMLQFDPDGRAWIVRPMGSGMDYEMLPHPEPGQW